MLKPLPPLEDFIEQGPVALFLDFDGTLVKLAPTPDMIEPAPGLGHALGRLSSRLKGAVALVSGRALDDIARHIGPLQVAGAGSHGADIRDASGAAVAKAATPLPDAIAAAMRDYAALHGLGYEEKPHGAALHYRGNEAKGQAAHDFAQALAVEHGWTTQSGKRVIELVAKGADKGSAVTTFLEREPFRGARPFFVGDDLTDESGFAACAAAGGAGICVGDRLPTLAHYQLPDVASVHRWLGL